MFGLMVSLVVNVGKRFWGINNMRKQPFKNVVVHTCGGACVGILLAAPFWSVLGRHLASAPILFKIWAIAEVPASCLGDIWTHQLNLPPHGEMAWAVPPAVAEVKHAADNEPYNKADPCLDGQ